MRRTIQWLFLTLCLAGALFSACANKSECDCSQSQNAKLQIGDPAPDFRLPDHKGGYVRLSDFKGQSNVVIAFYPAAFTPV